MRVYCILVLLFTLTIGDKLVVYDGTTGSLAKGWLNFSWAQVNLTDTTYVHTGDKYSASMVCTAWKGLYLSSPTAWKIGDYNLFTFWINGGNDGKEIITLTLTGNNNSKTLSVSDYILPDHNIPVKSWAQVTIPIEHFEIPSTNNGEIKGFWFQANSASGTSVTYFDDITFELGILPPINGPNLAVDVTSPHTEINPNIYGASIFWDSSNQAAFDTFAKDIKLPLNRIGGDGCTRYNWEVDSSNAGNDWYYMGGSGSTSITPGAFYDNFIDNNNKYQTKTVVTIPMIQYINKVNAYHCSYPKSVYGAQQSYNPYVHPNNDDCGNGVDTSGHNILDKDPLATDIPNTPDIQKKWIQHIIGKYGNSQKSGIIYQLDNEVSNWAFMHRDVHPQAVTYDEIVNQTIVYGSAVKEADPTAYLAAPSEIQFAWYPDWGGDKNVIMFLQNLKAYQDKNGKRILDSFDVHYPDANDNHWPKLTDVAHLRQVVDQHYPGTDISISEWTMAGAGPLNGALAVADQLGEFARNHVSFASIWGLSTQDITGPLGFAFKVFRNYDGKGSMFGDQYINGTTTADTTHLAIHAAIRKSDGSLTIMVINKMSADQKSTLTLKGFSAASTAHVYEYGVSNENAIVSKPDISVMSSGFTYSYSAFSITIVVLAHS